MTRLSGLSLSFVVALAGCGGSPVRAPTAPTQVAIISYAPFAPNAGSEDAQKECVFQQQLPQEIYARARSEGVRAKLVEPNEVGEAGELPLLRVETITANIRGGGSWTGDKWVVVRGTLARHGSNVGSFRIRESVGGGKYSACGTAEELANDTAQRIVEFLRDPKLDYEHGF